jgi:hypothetical protein
MTLGRNNTNRGESVNRIPKEEQEEATVEKVSEEIVEKAVKWASRYASCPHCETEQFFFERPGWNTTNECQDCESEVLVVG